MSFNADHAGIYLYVTEPPASGVNPLVFILDAQSLLPGQNAFSAPFENNPLEPPIGIVQDGDRVSRRYIPDIEESLSGGSTGGGGIFL